MFEKAGQPLLPSHKFLWRLLRSIFFGVILIVAAMLIGMLGYHYFEQLDWITAFVNAAMILSGMGPLSPLLSTGGKIFAGCYALFSGLAFIIIMGVIFAPVFHRFLHQFHLDEEEDEESNNSPQR